VCRTRPSRKCVYVTGKMSRTRRLAALMLVLHEMLRKHVEDWPITSGEQYSLHPTNWNDSKSPVRILTRTLFPLSIHVWLYHQKLDSLQSKNISLCRVVSDSMGPLGRRMPRKQKGLALPRYLVAYWIYRSSHFTRVWSNFFQKQASQKPTPVHPVCRVQRVFESGQFHEAEDFPVHFGVFTSEVAGAVLTWVVHDCYPFLSLMSVLAAYLPLKVVLCFPRRLSVFIPIIPDSFSGWLYNQGLGKNLWVRRLAFRWQPFTRKLSVSQRLSFDRKYRCRLKMGLWKLPRQESDFSTNQSQKLLIKIIQNSVRSNRTFSYTKISSRKVRLYIKVDFWGRGRIMLSLKGHEVKMGRSIT
jgi:hypothetical protein